MLILKLLALNRSIVNKLKEGVNCTALTLYHLDFSLVTFSRLRIDNLWQTDFVEKRVKTNVLYPIFAFKGPLLVLRSLRLHMFTAGRRGRYRINITAFNGLT